MKTDDSMAVVRAPTVENPFAVFSKPAGLPSAPLRAGDDCAVSRAAEIFPEIAEAFKPSRSDSDARLAREMGLLHRLDTAASGLLLFAATPEALSRMLAAQKAGLFTKTYRAECLAFPGNAAALGGFPPLDGALFERAMRGEWITLSSFFRAWGKGRRESRPVTEDSNFFAREKKGGALYSTKIRAEKTDGGAACECVIARGARHQARCHLAWAGLPILGDALYNSRAKPGERLRFECVSLSFPHPSSGKIVTLNLPDGLRMTGDFGF